MGRSVWFQFAMYAIATVVIGVFAAGVIAWVSPGVAPTFHRLVLRSLEICAVLCLFPWLWWTGQLSRRAWGLALPWSRIGAHLVKGWAAGFAMVGALGAVLILTGARHIPDVPTFDVVAVLLVKGMIVGVLVASIEELWFRGGLYAALVGTSAAPVTRAPVVSSTVNQSAKADDLGPDHLAPAGLLSWPIVRAALVTSVIYAAVHFIRPDDPVASPNIWSGFTVLSGSFARFGDPNIIDSALALFAAGALLAAVRWRTASVAACAGVHAGWVGAIYLIRKTSEVRSGAPGEVLVGTYDGVIGWGAAILFTILTCLYVVRAIRHRTEAYP